MKQNTLEVYDVVLLILAACEGGENGRTVIQKLTYLWSSHISQIEDVSFKPYYYGPYSAKLMMALDELIALGFIDETEDTNSKHEKHYYKLTADGKKVAKTTADEHRGEFERIKSVINTCNKHDSLKPTELSQAAKIHYMMYDFPDARRDRPHSAIIRTAKEIGWKMTEASIGQGIELLEKLKFLR